MTTSTTSNTRRLHMIDDDPSTPFNLSTLLSPDPDPAAAQMLMHGDPKRIMRMVQGAKPMEAFLPDYETLCTAERKRISTGLLSLDKLMHGGLSNELYILGAETSTGKSAFVMSLAQQVAAQGVDVLYFALEMKREEFIARGASAISYEHHLKDSHALLVTASDILEWQYDPAIHDFCKLAYSEHKAYSDEYFARYGKYLHIIQAADNDGGGWTISDISDFVIQYRQLHPNKPMAVFIDYLQMIRADAQDRSQVDRKTKTDVIVSTLKMLSALGMPVVAISSVGRSSYHGAVSTASFKESGDLEYTGGVLLGWNWHGVTDQTDTDKQANEKAASKERGYRNMRLDILKYRNAERDSSVHLKYYPAYNYFTEDTTPTTPANASGSGESASSTTKPKIIRA